jgi:hypothetical protein
MVTHNFDWFLIFNTQFWLATRVYLGLTFLDPVSGRINQVFGPEVFKVISQIFSMCLNPNGMELIVTYIAIALYPASFFNVSLLVMKVRFGLNFLGSSQWQDQPGG